MLETIRAKTARSLTIAQSQRRGELSREVELIRSDVGDRPGTHRSCARLWRRGYYVCGKSLNLSGSWRLIGLKLQRLVESGNEGRILREGAVVAILGRPNVGKSSLLNALLQSDRAIVTPIPGTTRDVLEELVSIEGIPVRLVDTANIRHTDDPVEAEGIRHMSSLGKMRTWH
ncbi:MAG: 50S ribosome-binding GTPase [Nitrospira sp.]|nr:50S ribosome-binding GTPase [Nitrospira sp.]